MAPDIDRPELRAYLLGGLDEARASALEARYLVDPVWLDAVAAEEGALIGDALADRLTVAERARFEAHYLASPVHRDRFAIAAALRDRASRPAPAAATNGFYGWMAMAAAVILAGLWIVSRPGPAPTHADTTPPPATVPRAAPPTRDPAPAPVPTRDPRRDPSQARALLAMTLSPLASRGAGAPVQTRPRGPVDLELRLEGAPAAGDRGYDVELQSVDGRVVWRGRARPAAAGTGFLATVSLPGETLAADDYLVVVTAAGDERARYVLRLR
jgi:hypothetical protein